MAEVCADAAAEVVGLQPLKGRHLPWLVRVKELVQLLEVLPGLSLGDGPLVPLACPREPDTRTHHHRHQPHGKQERP